MLVPNVFVGERIRYPLAIDDELAALKPRADLITVCP
jgi:hypothetical protein